MIPGRKSEWDGMSRDTSIETQDAVLPGQLVLPQNALGLVLFAHGSGSSRHSPRNRYVAQVLQSQKIGTLLFDLLTPGEESIDRYAGQLRFNIPFLAKRLVAATKWAASSPDTQDLPVGYFGASTGAGAAFVAASEMPGAISAIVSRGGRPDLAEDALGAVRTPALLIVGGEDEPVIALNRQALAKLKSADKKLVIVPGATHLFEEPGTLEEVARLAADWLGKHFGATKESPRRSPRPP